MTNSNKQIAYVIITKNKGSLSLWFTQASTQHADESKLVSYGRMKCGEVSKGETGDKDKHLAV